MAVSAVVGALLFLSFFLLQPQIMASVAPPPYLRRVSVGPHQPQLFVVSEMDAVLEAEQNTPERQFYIDGKIITLEAGDTVVDVGANIGSFARMASLMLAAKGSDSSGSSGSRGQGQVIALEPLPQLFEALTLNIKQHEEWAAQQHLAAAPIVAMQCGLGKPGLGSSSEAAFTFYPRCAAFSTMYRNDTDALGATLALVSNGGGGGQQLQLGGEGSSQQPAAPTAAGPSGPSFSHAQGQNGTVATTSWIQWLAQGVARSPLGVVYRPVHMAVSWALLLSGAKEVTCKLKTLSDVIRQQKLSEVSLLKINVERAEEDVLMGIEPEHWGLVKQVSMQLHDLDGRLARLETLLRSCGFPRVVTWQEPRFKGSSLCMMYASRRMHQS